MGSTGMSGTLTATQGVHTHRSDVYADSDVDADADEEGEGEAREGSNLGEEK